MHSDAATQLGHDVVSDVITSNPQQDEVLTVMLSLLLKMHSICFI